LAQAGAGEGKEFFEDMRSLNQIISSNDTQHLASLVKEETAEAKAAGDEAAKATASANEEEKKAEADGKKGGADAEKIAADADKDKAKKLETFAKEKLAELID